MPNTLAHLGTQGLLTRTLIPRADLKWIYIGCIIPDLPWILQRAVRVLLPAVDKYDLLLYSTIQSSLFFCVLLAASLALLTLRPASTFVLLSMSALFHLLLDAIQIKWANGALLFAPFNWQFTSFNLFWPEALPSDLLTIFGFIYVLFMWRRACTPAQWQSKRRLHVYGFAIGLAILYLLGPPMFKSGPLKQNNFHINTLRNENERTGKAIVFDRALLNIEGDQAKVRNFNFEWFDVEGIEPPPEKTTLISLKGRFLAPNRIKVSSYHIHPLTTRATASIIGLTFILALWLCVLIRPLRQKLQPPEKG